MAQKWAWATHAIASIWLAVLFVGIFAPDFQSSNAAGDRTTIPSGLILGLFAMVATIVVARRGFGSRD